jgi:hypothetical protein
MRSSEPTGTLMALTAFCFRVLKAFRRQGSIACRGPITGLFSCIGLRAGPREKRPATACGTSNSSDLAQRTTPSKSRSAYSMKVWATITSGFPAFRRHPGYVAYLTGP